MGLETIGVASRELLQMLDITSAGIGPDHLNPEVRVTIEGQSYMGQRSLAVEAAFAFAAGAGGDFNVGLQVPPSSIWILRAFGWYLEYPASAFVQVYRFAAFIQAATRPPTTRAIPLGTAAPTLLGTAAGTLQRYFGGYESRQTTVAGNPGPVRMGANQEFGNAPLILPPGAIVGAEAFNGAAATDITTTINVWARFNELTPAA